MFGMTTVGMEGLVESFKAQFKPDANGDGYLFFADEYGEGVPCTHAQYEAYVSDFEDCVRRSHRFMVRWAIAMFFLLLIVMVIAVWQLGSDILDGEGRGAQILFTLLFVSPLPYLFWQGNQVRKRPLEELVSKNPDALAVTSTGKRRSSKDIYVQRVRGMSSTGIGYGIFAGIIGIGTSAYEYSNTGEFKLYYLMFPAVLLCFIALVWVRHKATQEDRKILTEQTQYNIQKAQDAWLELNQLAVHSSAKVDIQHSILSVGIPVSGTDDFRSADPSQYFYEIQMAVGANDGVFILSMDWKEAVRDYFWKLGIAVGNELTQKLPDVDHLPSNASIHYGSVLEDTVEALQDAGYIQIFINDLSDSYNVLLFREDDVDEAVKAIERLHMKFSISFP